MSAEFVDTNILVYAYDPTSPAKHKAARHLMEDLWNRGEGRLSVQVLQEFFWTVTRKVPRPLSPALAREPVADFSTWTTFVPDAGDVLAAIDLGQEQQISFWDAMIVLAAIRSNCSTLWSEDMAHGSQYDSLLVRNPFR